MKIYCELCYKEEIPFKGGFYRLKENCGYCRIDNVNLERFICEHCSRVTEDIYTILRRDHEKKEHLSVDLM